MEKVRVEGSEVRIMNGSEILEEMEELRKDWTKKVYIREDGVLVLNIRYQYLIDLSRIDTKEKILSWVYHLTEKNWASREMFYRMLKLLEEHFGMEFNVPA